MNVEVRPWGRFVVLYWDKNTWLKRLIISPGQSLSLQYHEHRDEYMTTQDSGVHLRIGMDDFAMNPGSVYMIRSGHYHRLSNPTDQDVFVTEWAVGNPDENDIVRLEDNYGRS